MPSSSAIGNAVVARLGADATLLAICQNGAYMDVAPPGSTRYVLVSLVIETDIPKFGGRAIEDALYFVRAVILSTTGADIKAASDRIDVLLEDQPLVVSGYTWMACHREEHVRFTDPDEDDASIRWHNRGGRYRIQMSVS